MTSILRKPIDKFFDEDYLGYATYVVENRAIPSVIDGFKPTQRKIICAANRVWKTGNEKFLKIFQLAGTVAATMYYHHGDCLDYSTKILLHDGTYITIGDWYENFPDAKLELISFDEATNEWKIGIGHSPRIGNNTDEEIEIELESGETFSCTGNHPFYTTNRGWVNAEDLTDDDNIFQHHDDITF